MAPCTANPAEFPGRPTNRSLPVVPRTKESTAATITVLPPHRNGMRAKPAMLLILLTTSPDLGPGMDEGRKEREQMTTR